MYKSGGFHEKDWAAMEQEYDKMVSVADSIGARLVLVHIPQKGPWTEDSRYPAARFSAWAGKRGVEFVDILPAMEHRAAAGERLYYPKDGHCTPAGHAVIAEALYRHLTGRSLVP